jgi:hypothetical protein
VAAFGSLALVGCILAVSPERYGDTCRFEGEDTQCGACVVDRCRTEMNDCCSDEACDATVRTVESCASRHDQSCAEIANGAGRFALARCVTEKCGGVCVAFAGSSLTSCKEPLLDESAACSCRYSGGGNDFACNPAAYRDTICCAPNGWPGVGLECSCRPIECNASAGGCFCLTVEGTPTQRECTGPICCAQNDSCSCGSKPCFQFQTQVATCNLAAVGCRENQIRVDSCSLRKP